MIVLGIDPGTAALGWGVVESRSGRLRMVDSGCLTTKPDVSLPRRLLAIHTLLDELLSTHEPDIVAVERLFFSRNAQTAFGVGQARGVVLLAAAQANVPVREATPSEVKVAVTGHGRAEKDQVGRMVAVCLSLAAPPQPDDTADALAIAIWGANAERPGVERRSAVLDRAAVDPMPTNGRGNGANGHGAAGSYERAVKEALAREEPERRARLRSTGRA
ncbi:MAG TPA: crossover junction endodeoxyribonuclease RuvC [Candidatus Binatia bacterium]|nr:crossover junction endodeoxyribonuclease RuvC [Candidatus Binatia bacterium]